MEIKELEPNNFNNVIKKEAKVVIDVYATWCPPCKMLSPVIDKIAKENKDYSFYKLDIDRSEEVAEQYEITNVPTILIFEKSKLKNTIVGLKSKKEIEDLLK